MRAAYFSFETTGSDFDVDTIISFSGLKYDHQLSQKYDKFTYQVVGDTAMVNDRPHPHYEAIDKLYGWMSEDCFYFTVNADKKKHFLRKTFFNNYLNPYGHERKRGLDKIIDFMELMRASHFLGTLPFEIPVSPIGELSYEIADILALNSYGINANEFMAHTNQKVIDGGGEPFRLIKSRKEKAILLSGRLPIVMLAHINKEISVSSEIVVPIVRSEENKNRFYVWRPGGENKSPVELLQAIIENMRAGGSRATTREKDGSSIFYIDINKSGIIASIDEIPTSQKVLLRNERLFDSRLNFDYKAVVETLDKLDEIKQLNKNRYEKSNNLYSNDSNKGSLLMGAKIRAKALRFGYEGALQFMSKNSFANSYERKRLNIFCYNNDIKTISPSLSFNNRHK